MSGLSQRRWRRRAPANRMPIISLRLWTAGFAVLIVFGSGILLLSTHTRAATAGITPVASSSCGPLQYGGNGAPDALIVSDLPLQGDSRQRSTQMNDAIRLVLEGSNWKAGNTRIAFQ